MSILQTILIDIGRVGFGLIFFLSIFLDLKARAMLFDLMQQKNVSMPWLFYIGAMACKALTGLALVFNIYTFWAAIILAIYTFIATCIFWNFWKEPKDTRDMMIGSFMIHMAACFALLVIAGVALGT